MTRDKMSQLVAWSLKLGAWSLELLSIEQIDARQNAAALQGPLRGPWLQVGYSSLSSSSGVSNE